jgi:hypothetical protein
MCGSYDLQANPSVAQNPLDFVEEIVDQGYGVLQVRAFLDPPPCDASDRSSASLFKPRALGRHIVRVVEADQSRPVGRVKRKRIGQAVRPVLGCLDARNFEFKPVALFEMMDTSVEREQELEAMARPRRIISSGDMIARHSSRAG